MIDLKPPEEEKPVNLFYQQLEEESSGKDLESVRKAFGNSDATAKELHALNNTLKEILREMRKRK